MEGITISMSLDIVYGPGGGFVKIPNCEPSNYEVQNQSGLYNPQKKIMCCGSLARLTDVMAAIPGATIVTIPNSMIGGVRQLLVLPPKTDNCPCNSATDWYKIIKDVACENPIEEEDRECSIIDFGFCPNPDFENIPAPPPDPYL